MKAFVLIVLGGLVGFLASRTIPSKPVIIWVSSHQNHIMVQRMGFEYPPVIKEWDVDPGSSVGQEVVIQPISTQ